MEKERGIRNEEVGKVAWYAGIDIPGYYYLRSSFLFSKLFSPAHQKQPFLHLLLS